MIFRRGGDVLLHQGQGLLFRPQGRADISRSWRFGRRSLFGCWTTQQLLVSSVIVENQERSLSLVICSFSVTNFSSMGHLVWLWMMALAKWHHPDGGVNRSEAGTGTLDPVSVFWKPYKGPKTRRSRQYNQAETSNVFPCNLYCNG
jgi:hypothetical protein